MKKILLVVLIIFTIITLFACTNPKPNPGNNGLLDPASEFEEAGQTKIYTAVDRLSNSSWPTVKILTKNLNEDDPWHKDFSPSDKTFRYKMQNKYNMVSEKYKANIVFEEYTNENKVACLQQEVAANNEHSVIARIDSQQELIDLVSHNLLTGLNKEVASLNEKEEVVGDNEFIKKNVSGAGQFINSYLKVKDSEGNFHYNTFGSSRSNGGGAGVSFNCFIYNRSLIKEAGCEDPAYLWEKGQWTYTEMKKMGEKINNYMKTSDKYNKPKASFYDRAKPFGFYGGYYIFDMLAMRRGHAVTESMLNGDGLKELKEVIDEWKLMNGDKGRGGINQPSKELEMTHNVDPNPDGTKNIVYEGCWQKWVADSPNPHNAARCFEVEGTAFAMAAPWMFHDYILGSNNIKKDGDFKVGILPFPADMPGNRGKEKARVLGATGDMLVLSKAKNSKLSTQIMLELVNVNGDHGRAKAAYEIKTYFANHPDREAFFKAQYPEGTSYRDMCIDLAKKGTINAEKWVVEHMINNNNADSSELGLFTKIFESYTNPNKIIPNEMEKYGSTRPVLDAMYRYAIDDKDFTQEIKKASDKVSEITDKLLKSLIKIEEENK